MQVFEYLNQLCNEFQEAWRDGRRPELESFIGRVAPDARETLFRNLLPADISHRKKVGERPQSADYLRRFPEFSGLIRQTFLESITRSTSFSPAAEWETEQNDTHAVPITLDCVAPVASRLGSYELVRELGRGGFGIVFEAIHVLHGNRVALKTLPAELGQIGHSQTAERLHRFKREFRLLAEMNHPNLVGLHSLEADGPQWFVTMELVRGKNFFDHVRPAGTLDLARLRSSLTQLVAGVMAIHSQNKVHRDLKPSNVLVDHDGRIVILDFGLVAEIERETNLRSVDFAGTPAYAPPEQWTGEATASSDWYAVGVMLFEALTGERPFRERDPVKLLLQKRQQVPSLDRFADELPRDLVELCRQLLDPLPENRPDAFEIIKIIAKESGYSRSPASGARGLLIGRESQLDALRHAADIVDERREPSTMFISGRSGEGKSSLIARFLEPLNNGKRFTVLAGRCYDRESVPFKALDSLIDALAHYLRGLDDADAALLMPDDIAFLGRLFPVLRRVKIVARVPSLRLGNLNQQQVRQRAFQALRLLLNRISERTPIIMVIDDLQWGDADSARATFEILRPPHSPAILFVGGFRSDETDESSFLRQWQAMQREQQLELRHKQIRVGPLTVEHTVELMINRLGRDSENIRRRAIEFFQETGGNPFFLNELIDCFDPDAASFQPLSVGEVIEQKLKRLPEEAAGLLEVVAIAGMPLAMEEALQAAGCDVSAVATVTRMRSEQLVRLVGGEDQPRVDTYHDRIRESLHDRVADPRKFEIHRTIGEQLEQRLGLDAEALAEQLNAYDNGDDAIGTIDRVYDLGFHFESAGDDRKSWIYNLLAAEQARKQLALEVAAERFAVAQRAQSDAAPTVKFRTAKGAGSTLILMGRYDEATRQLEPILDWSEDRVQKAGVELLLGETAFKSGDIGRSGEFLENGLRQLGTWVPKGKLGLIAAVTRETLVQTWHTKFPRRLGKKEPTLEADLTGLLLARLVTRNCFTNATALAWAVLRGMNHTELYAPSRSLAFNYAVHSAVMSGMMGWESRGTSYFDRAIQLSRGFEDVWLQGVCFNWRGVGNYGLAKYEQAIEQLTEASKLFDKAGDLWERNMAQFHLGQCHFKLGDLQEAIRLQRETCLGAIKLGDNRALCSSYGWCHASEGRLPMNELRNIIPHVPQDTLSTANLHKALGYWHLTEGRTAEAVELFDQAWSKPLSNGLVMMHTVAARPLLVRALREHADSLAAEQPAEAKRLRRRALRIAKFSRYLAKMFPCEMTPALRECGLAHAGLGNERKALKFLERSCESAKRYNERYDLAISSLELAKLRHRMGIPGAERELNDAEEAIEPFRQVLESAFID